MDYNAKYRPADLGDIIGQQKAVRQLRRLLQLDPAQLPHAYHFNGPTGVGKTSAARIFARHLETNKDFIWELDGAKTGNAEVNELARRSQYRTHSGGKRILIVDEAQGLEKGIWDSLLKVIEDSPDHLFWIFCSTDDRKIPDTIKKGRLQRVDFRAIPTGIIERRLKKIVDEEESLHALPKGTCERIASLSEGSLRKAYSVLEGAQGITSEEEVDEYLTAPDKDPALKYFMQQVVQYPSQKQQGLVLTLFKGLGNYHPETVRVVACQYITATILNDKTGEKKDLSLLLHELTGKEYHSADGHSALLSALFNYWRAVKPQRVAA